MGALPGRLESAAKPFAAAVNALPERAREFVYTWSGRGEAIPPDKLGEVDAEDVSRWVADYYPKRRYPAVAVGSSSGALVHLCAALDIPWLPQTFLVALESNGISPDDPQKEFEWGKEHARAVLDANPNLTLHHMLDPSQDRLMSRRMSYFRLKRLRLGAAYESFLEENLEEGGAILLPECNLKWPTTKAGERHVFQFGGFGGATAEEFLHGGERVEKYLRQSGSNRLRWDPPEPDAESPEAEWGFEPELREDIERFAREKGYKVRRVSFDEPDHLSPLVADLHRWWYGRRGMSADRLLAESFVLMDPLLALRAGLVPFWTSFNTESSADLLESYLDGAETYDEIRLMLFSHGVDSIGLAPMERWKSILQKAGKKGELLGVDEKKYPKDFAAFVRYHTELKQFAGRSSPQPLTLEELDEFLAASSERYPVRWE